MKSEWLDCAAAREAVHVALDAEPFEGDLGERLESHLAGCASCREFAAEMQAIQRGLCALPELELPDAVLERVWDRTTRTPRRRPWYWTAAAAAIVVAGVLGGMWLRLDTAASKPSEAELRRGAEEARLVLGLTSRTLQQSGYRAVDQVLTDEVSPALRRVPIEWPRQAAWSGS